MSFFSIVVMILLLPPITSSFFTFSSFSALALSFYCSVKRKEKESTQARGRGKVEGGGEERDPPSTFDFGFFSLPHSFLVVNV